MVMVLEVEMVEAIASIGRFRAPAEACGILLPYPIHGRSVWELPNRSLTPHDSFEMTGQDMMGLFERLNMDHEVIQKLIDAGGFTAWHTHPEGNVGPSLYDLQNKPAHLKSLVVSLPEKGRPLATWY